MTTTTEKPDPYSYLTLSPEAQGLFSAAASDLTTFATGTPRSPNTKVITVIFDGTGQNKDAGAVAGETTTVAAAMQKKLHDQALADGGSSVEPVYVRGIGSPPANSTDASLVDGALALTAKGRLDEAWKGYIERAQAILAEDPTANIQVNVVGFSRGAALAREFMNRVDELGVPSGSTPISYSNGELNCNAVTYSYGELSRKGGEVKQTALLFDTVATSMNTVLEPKSLLDPASSGNSVTTVADSTYVPIRLSIPDSVDSVVHFLSANDTRDTLFRPTSIQVSGSGTEPDPRFAEIVLPGVHSDTGGTFNEGPQAYMKALGLQVLKNYGVYDGPVELPALPTQITNYNATRNLFTGDTLLICT